MGSENLRRLGFVVMCLTGCFAANARGDDRPSLPTEFVFLRQVDASIFQDIRYAKDLNFMGTRVPGYAAPECILLRPVAEALKLVQADLQPHNLSLKVYDCYRPIRAVKAFMRWVQNTGINETDEGQYWPRTRRIELVKLGYIASSSVHSTGAAVDLTLVSLPVAGPAPKGPTLNSAACNFGKGAHDSDTSLDMGTSFDCFDPMSHTASDEITPEQRDNRQMLVAAMAARGFKNYAREWWHFTYTRLPLIPKAQDFLIVKPSKKEFEPLPAPPAGGR
jgi:D-alanyl-D-alanine dipeptidase